MLDGGTLAGVAREWNRRGVFTYTGNRWTLREVGRVLRRPRNAGLMEYQGVITGRASWPAVVDEQTWRQVVAILDKPGRRTTPGPSRKHLLSWLARCGVCGGPMICSTEGRAAAKGKPRRLVYRCRDSGQGHLSRDGTQLDSLITKLVLGRLSRDDAADLLMPDRKAELARINREIRAINEDMKADLRLYREKVLTELEFARIRRDRQADLAAAETRLTDLSTADALAPLIANPALWADLDLDRKRAVIDTLMTVKIMPAPRGRPAGWRAGQPYFDPRSVEITWRKSLP